MGKRSTRAQRLTGRGPQGLPRPRPLAPRRRFHGWLSASQSPGPPHPPISALPLSCGSYRGATSQGPSSPLRVLTPLPFPSNGTCGCHSALNPLTSNSSPSTSHRAVITWNCQPSGSILFRLVSRGAAFQQEESGWGFQPVPLPVT